MFDRFYLTDAGRALLASATAGSPLALKRAQVGKGSLPADTQPAAVTQLIDLVDSFPLSGVSAAGDTATVRFQFKNQLLTSAFQFREVGLTAQSGEGEVLVAYANAGADADYIPAPTASQVEFEMKFTLSHANAENVSALIDGSLVYLTQTDVIDLSHGGTGATSASAACESLGAVQRAGDTMTGPLTLGGGSAASVPLKLRRQAGGKALLAQQAISDGGSVELQLFEEGNDTPLNSLTLGATGSSLGKPLAIASGGHGGTTPEQARANLGITPANIGAVQKAGDTMTGTLNGTSAIFNAGISSGKSTDRQAEMNGSIGANAGEECIFVRSRLDGTTKNGIYLYDTKTSFMKPLVLASGGTGATTAKEACENLEAEYLGVGEAIPSDADLNDYTSPGTYYSRSGAISATLINTPYTVTGFRMTVCHIMSTGQIVQEIKANSASARTYRRISNKQSDGSWDFGSWYQVVQSTDGIVPVGLGGTGATTAAAACQSLGAVKKSGDTMTGTLVLPYARVIKSSWPSVGLCNANNDSESARFTVSDSNTIYLSSVCKDTSYAENFRLPTPNTGRTANADYTVLTTKHAVTVEQGGTGAATAAAARSKLGITPANIGAAAVNHGTHVSYSTAAPKAAGTASAGTAASAARSDHVHPIQTTVSGNAGSATKLATARTLSLSGGATGTATSFNGTANITIPVTALDVSKASAGTLPVARGGTGGTSAAAGRKGLGIQAGTVAFTCASNGNKDVTVTFSTAYGATPVITLTPLATFVSAANINYWSILSSSKTGFTFRFYHEGSNTPNVVMQWMAMG